MKGHSRSGCNNSAQEAAKEHHRLAALSFVVSFSLRCYNIRGIDFAS